MIETGFIVFTLFFFGCAIGSFLHVVAERYGTKDSVLRGRSYCPHCKKTLSSFELIPLLSYIYSRAKCKGCGAEIPFHYAVLELATGCMAVLLLLPSIISGLHMVPAMLLFIAACVLIILIRIDVKLMLLPDAYIYLLTGVALLHRFVSGSTSEDAIFGVLAGSGALYLLWAATLGRGIGFGDVKLMIPLGILFGFKGVVALLFFSFVAGGLVSIFLLAAKRVTPKTAVPFGPFLAGSGLLLMAFPEAPDRFFMLLGV